MWTGVNDIFNVIVFIKPAKKIFSCIFRASVKNCLEQGLCLNFQK
jgi:hypothetical protein